MPDTESVLLIHAHLPLTRGQGVLLDRAHTAGPEHYAKAVREIATVALSGSPHVEFIDGEEI